MARYANVFQEDAERQLAKPGAKPKPKPGPKKHPPAGAGAAADAAVRDIARSAAQTSQTLKQSVAPKTKPLRSSSASDFSRLAAEARERLRSGDKPKNNIQVGNMGFAYAPDVTPGSSVLGRIARGVAGDATSIVTGLPALGVAAVRGAEYPVAKGLGLAGVDAAARQASGTEKIFKDMGSGIVNDYRDRYGDIWDVSLLDLIRNSDHARDKYRKAGGKAADHPLFTAGDAALVFGGAGGAIGASGRALGRLAPESRIGEAGARMGSRAIGPGSARFREPRRLESKLGENTAKGKKGPGTNVVEINRRPYSPNPLTRVVQKTVVDPLVDKAIGRIDRVGEGSKAAPVAKLVGTQARYNRRATRAGRDLSREFELERSKVVRQEASKLREGTKRMSPEEQAALFLHRRDLLDVPGKTPAQARDDVVRMMEEGRTELVGTRGAKDKNTQKVIEAIRSVPDDLLDLKTATPKIVEAVAEARRIGKMATEKRVAAGTLDAEGAAARARRGAEMVHGGSRFDPKRVAETPEVLAAREGLSDAIAARTAGPRRPNTAQVFGAGRKFGRGDRNLELARPIPTAPRRQPAIPNPGDLGPRGGVRIDGPGFARPKGISASQSRAYRQMIGGRGRQVELKSAARQAEQASRRVREARTQLTKVEKRNRGSFTPPATTGLGRNAVYDPDIAVDRMAGRAKGSPSGDFNRLTQEKDRQSKGTLFGSGNVAISPETTVRALERAVADEIHPVMMERFKEQFAYKRNDGSFVTGDKALKMEADSDTVALVSLKSFEDARKRMEDMPEGEFPANPLDGIEVYEGAEGFAKAKALKGKDRQQLIAVSKKGLQGLREGWGSTGPRIKVYDTGLSLWKRGMLPFAPRWYLNNLFGNTMVYGMLTGGDMRSFRQAGMKRAGEAVPERVAGGLAEQTKLEYGGNFRGREPSRARQRFDRASDFGFRANHHMESWIRRAAWINRMKKGMRQEGMLTRAQMRKMSDQELMDALDKAPVHLREQALRETELFLGDFVRMNPFEQNVLRRVFPWYSWMRVIGRLSFGLPLRHPLRASVGALVATATNQAMNPEDYMREIYNRGRVGIGPVSLRTSSLNPFSTHLEMGTKALAGDWAGVAGDVAGDLSPAAAPFVQTLTGRNAFGDPFSHPAGFNGISDAFGKSGTAIDPATHLPEDRMATPGLGELFFRQLPLIPSIARAAASGNRDPYDTTGIMDLLQRSKTPDQLFWPKQGNDSQAFGPVLPAGLQQLLNLAAPVQRHDVETERRQYRDRLKRQRDAERQTRKRKAKAAARER